MKFLNSVLFILFFSILSFLSFGHITYEKGYYINNNNQKIECFIKNIEWRNCPVNFVYKITKQSNESKNNIDLVKEFCIYDQCKYVRANILVDTSSIHIDSYTLNSRPLWTKMQVFLKVIVEGKTNLY